MKAAINWIKTNKTTIIGALIAVMLYLKTQGIVTDTECTFISSALSALGLTAAKDNNKHSTPEEVHKAGN